MGKWTWTATASQFEGKPPPEICEICTASGLGGIEGGLGLHDGVGQKRSQSGLSCGWGDHTGLGSRKTDLSKAGVQECSGGGAVLSEKATGLPVVSCHHHQLGVPEFLVRGRTCHGLGVGIQHIACPGQPSCFDQQ